MVHATHASNEETSGNDLFMTYRNLALLLVGALIIVLPEEGVGAGAGLGEQPGNSPGVAMTIPKHPSLNVLQEKLEVCGVNPQCGFYRDGFCATGEDDHGLHVVCAVVTQEFLEFSRTQGNDLITPRPHLRFPGLTPGDRWCLCALRWKEALIHQVAPPVVLEATHAKALEIIPLEDLKKHQAPRPEKPEPSKKK